MASHVSGSSSVPLVFQAVEIPVDRAPYAQQMNDYLSGGKSVRVAGSIQSPHAVLQSWPRSNCRSQVQQPFWFIKKDRGGNGAITSRNRESTEVE
jgi:hypothetical protein